MHNSSSAHLSAGRAGAFNACMFDISQDDLFEALDRVVSQLLERGGVEEPPTDALHLAQALFGIRLEYLEEGEDPAQRPRRRDPQRLFLRSDQSEESQHFVAARAIAQRAVPDVLTRLGIPPGTENRLANQRLAALIATRLLLPTRWFERAVRDCDADLLALKECFPSAGYDLLAQRILEVDDEPCVVASIEDGSVVWRRSNRFSVNKTLTAAEQECVERIADSNEAVRVRRDDWTAWGWPTPGIPFGRIIVRAVPDLV